MDKLSVNCPLALQIIIIIININRPAYIIDGLQCD